MGACLCSTGACSVGVPPRSRGALLGWGRAPARWGRLFGRGACSVGAPARSGRLLGRGALLVGARLSRRPARPAPSRRCVLGRRLLAARSARAQWACAMVGACRRPCLQLGVGRRVLKWACAWSAPAAVGVRSVGVCLCWPIWCASLRATRSLCRARERRTYVRSARVVVCTKYSRTCVTSFERGFGWQATRLAVIKNVFKTIWYSPRMLITMHYHRRRLRSRHQWLSRSYCQHPIYYKYSCSRMRSYYCVCSSHAVPHAVL